MRTHSLEGRKREERLDELRNVARHKRALTNWRGGRGRSGLVSFESWHVTNEHSRTGGEEEGGAALGASNRGTAQTSTHHQAGRERGERGGIQRHVARREPGQAQRRCGNGPRGAHGAIAGSVHRVR